MFRGNKRLGDSRQLSLQMEEMGGDLNAITSFDMTEYWLDFHIDYFEAGIQRFCDFIKEPQFEDIELERSIILEELKADYNEQDQLIDLDTISSAEIWKDNGFGLPVTGTRESIKRISREDLENWYCRFYRPGNMLIGIAGDIDVIKTFGMFENHFPSTTFSSRMKYQTVSASCTGRSLLLVDNKDNQYSLQWSFPTYPLSANLRIRYQLIRRILDDGSSSRLQRLIREEKGLVYDISADMLFFDSGAMLSINSLIGIERLPELISVAADLIDDLDRNGITPEELELSSRRYRIAQDCNQDTPQGILFEAMAPLIHDDILPHGPAIKLLSETTVADINDTLKGLFRRQGCCFTMVGPSPEQHRRMLERGLKRWLLS